MTVLDRQEDRFTAVLGTGRGHLRGWETTVATALIDHRELDMGRFKVRRAAAPENLGEVPMVRFSFLLSDGDVVAVYRVGCDKPFLVYHLHRLAEVVLDELRQVSEVAEPVGRTGAFLEWLTSTYMNRTAVVGAGIISRDAALMAQSPSGVCLRYLRALAEFGNSEKVQAVHPRLLSEVGAARQSLRIRGLIADLGSADGLSDDGRRYLQLTS